MHLIQIASAVVIVAVKTDKTGTLNFEQFIQLLTTIKEWKDILFKTDINRSGQTDKEELSRALKLSGIARGCYYCTSVCIIILKV